MQPWRRLQYFLGGFHSVVPQSGWGSTGLSVIVLVLMTMAALVGAGEPAADPRAADPRIAVEAAIAEAKLDLTQPGLHRAGDWLIAVQEVAETPDLSRKVMNREIALQRARRQLADTVEAQIFISEREALGARWKVVEKVVSVNLNGVIVLSETTQFTPRVVLAVRSSGISRNDILGGHASLAAMLAAGHAADPELAECALGLRGPAELAVPAAILAGGAPAGDARPKLAALLRLGSRDRAGLIAYAQAMRDRGEVAEVELAVAVVKRLPKDDDPWLPVACTLALWVPRPATGIGTGMVAVALGDNQGQDSLPAPGDAAAWLETARKYRQKDDLRCLLAARRVLVAATDAKQRAEAQGLAVATLYSMECAKSAKALVGP